MVCLYPPNEDHSPVAIGPRPHFSGKGSCRNWTRENPYGKATYMSRGACNMHQTSCGWYCRRVTRYWCTESKYILLSIISLRTHKQNISLRHCDRTIPRLCINFVGTFLLNVKKVSCKYHCAARRSCSVPPLVFNHLRPVASINIHQCPRITEHLPPLHTGINKLVHPLPHTRIGLSMITSIFKYNMIIMGWLQLQYGSTVFTPWPNTFSYHTITIQLQYNTNPIFNHINCPPSAVESMSRTPPNWAAQLPES